tara:strand:- start:527 stop:694 length:168 start_codon:yes stop_codon:yes gene_type:complete
MYVFYRSIAFKHWGSIVFSSKASIIVENVELGHCTVESVEVNASVDFKIFEMPKL